MLGRSKRDRKYRDDAQPIRHDMEGRVLLMADSYVLREMWCGATCKRKGKLKIATFQTVGIVNERILKSTALAWKV